MTVPEKAAPIPAEVLALAEQHCPYNVLSVQQQFTVLNALQRIVLADRKARVGCLSDRRRVELLLIIDQLLYVVRTGADGPDAARCIDLLRETRAGLEAPASEDEVRILRRLARLDRDHFAPLRRWGEPVAAFGLVVYMLLERLTAADYLVVPADGPFREALGILLPALEPIAQEPGRMEEASGRADAILAGLGRDGLFRDLSLFVAQPARV